MPRGEFVGLLSWCRAALVDVRGGGLDEGGDTASGDFLAEREGEGVAAHFVDIVGLGVTGFAAAVNHIVELFAIGSVEDAREMFCGRGSGFR